MAAGLRHVSLDTILYQLFLLNVTLQMFDGMATYSGMNLGCPEANPLVCIGFGILGIGQTLLLLKALACGLLLLVYRVSRRQLAVGSLGALAGAYYLCSFIPWSAVLLSALLTPS